MKIPIYQVDAFAENVFSGNPAAVCPLDEWLPTETMQAIAEENNLSETAFFLPNGNSFDIRWFTPKAEIDLAGHPTSGDGTYDFHGAGAGSAERDVQYEIRRYIGCGL